MLGCDLVGFEDLASISLGVVAFLVGPVFFGPPCTQEMICKVKFPVVINFISSSGKMIMKTVIATR